MSPEEQARGIIDNFRFPPGWRASYGMVEDIAAAIRAAVKAEREACEQIAMEEIDIRERMGQKLDQNNATGLVQTALRIAAAIRARKEAPAEWPCASPKSATTK